jgi:Ca-activated chloride channel family protein
MAFAARRAAAALLAGLLAAAVLAGCFPSRGADEAGGDFGDGGGDGGGGGGGGITVLAGSELKDVEPLLADAERATGVRVHLEYVGTLEGAERIAGGNGTALAWFSSDRYLRLLTAGGAHRPVASTKIMVSPVVLGVKRSVADRFGWTGNPDVTWKDIADKAKAGQLRYGMTNPAASNSGFSALLGVAAAFSGSGGALERGDVDAQRLTDFFTGQTLTAGSSGFLADAYVAQQDSLDGLINYESVLLQLNRGGELREPLQLVYPREGIVTADYPLLLFDQGQRAAYDKLAAWLRTPDVQRRLMATTSRRPAVPEVQPDAAFPARTLVELPFPADRAVVDQLILSYLDRYRRPAHALFVLDVSGSMEGERLDDLKRALTGLTGADGSVSGRFARFRERERITLITFNSDISREQDIALESAAPDSAGLATLRGRIDGVRAGGGTAIWTAMRRAYQRVQSDAAADRGYLTTIVLMTDGENTRGITFDEFRAAYQALPREIRAVRTFAIQFGEADPGELEAAAQTTGGAVFNANDSSLSAVFKEIRGYQ